MELTKEHFVQTITGLKHDATATEKRIIKRIDEAQEERARKSFALHGRSC
jgi:hypothetical protein